MSSSPSALADQVTDLDALGREWDRGARLSSIKTRRKERDALDAADMLDIVGWADDHRADVVASFADSALLPGHDDYSMPIMMSGVPVDEFCLAELATALRISQGAARARTEQSLEVRERLPRLWVKVHTGVLPAWRAREVARETLSLSDEAADYVDRQLAPFASTLTTTRIKNLVNAAVLRFDPDRAAAEAAEAADNRGVWFDFDDRDLPTDGTRPDGTSRMEAVADTLDLLALKDALKTKARELEILGDDSSEQVRMAKALGIVADPQHALDLSASAEAALAEEPTGEDTAPRRRPNRVRTPLGIERPIHIHLHTSTDVARIQASGLPHTASPISRAVIERWIAELAPGAVVKVTPVVDLNRNHAVDAYEAPDHIRAQVTERDHTCVFPFCTNRGRFDLDHTTEYVDPDDGGPPGQTGNRLLAKLCRYHHRAKTHTTWTYKRVESVVDLDPSWPGPFTPTWVDDSSTVIEPSRDPDTGGPPAAYLWTSPLGYTYLVTATGTYPRD